MSDDNIFSDDEGWYAQRGTPPGPNGLGTYEYLSESGSYRIEPLTFADGFDLADELDEAGDWEEFEQVLQRWAGGYRKRPTP